MKWTWGPDTLGTVSTALALLLLAVGYLISVLDGRRSQAALVTAWMVHEENEGAPSAVSKYRHGWYLYVQNGSTEPAYHISVVSRSQGSAPAYFDVLPPKATDRRYASDMKSSHASKHSASLVIWLTDSNGRRWRRGPDGRLRRQWLRERTAHGGPGLE